MDEEAANGSGPSAVTTETKVDEADDGPIIGPGPAPRARPKRPLQFEQAYLESLPNANM